MNFLIRGWSNNISRWLKSLIYSPLCNIKSSKSPHCGTFQVPRSDSALYKFSIHSIKFLVLSCSSYYSLAGSCEARVQSFYTGPLRSFCPLGHQREEQLVPKLKQIHPIVQWEEHTIG